LFWKHFHVCFVPVEQKQFTLQCFPTGGCVTFHAYVEKLA
jgi:hypothetical protein